jgi:hypothetical protein
VRRRLSLRKERSVRKVLWLVARRDARGSINKPHVCLHQLEERKGRSRIISESGDGGLYCVGTSYSWHDLGRPCLWRLPAFWETSTAQAELS